MYLKFNTLAGICNPGLILQRLQSCKCYSINKTSTLLVSGVPRAAATVYPQVWESIKLTAPEGNVIKLSNHPTPLGF